MGVYSSEPEAHTRNELTGVATGSGGLFRLAFGRPNLVGPLSDACALGTDEETQNRVASALASPLGGFGNLPRNPCRANSQKRMDFAISKSTQLTEGSRLELRAEFFNLFNLTNFAPPVNDLQDSTFDTAMQNQVLSGDFGAITNTIGGPRIIQFGLRVVF